MSGLFENKTVLVTGATGSFGNTVVPELLRRGAGRVVAYSRGEEKQWRMRRKLPDSRLRFVIGDVRDFDRVLDAAKDADYVYHAAALKFVPTCEDAPNEAYKTNITGSLNVREACRRNGVARAILVSTDKAVKPINAYGMSKAMAEKLWLQDELRTDTLFGVVRYGNVLGSRGSIIPLFRELIQEGKPLPITDSRMNRFFLTLDQAIDLVIYATEHMRGGEIFIPNNPASPITDLALALAGPDYPLDVVGIRPGEKISEVLISEEETYRTEDRGERFVIHPVGAPQTGIEQEFTSANARQLSVAEITAILSDAGL
jgi:FlaA1/EpsC-like NDP-sugar epimerase